MIVSKKFVARNCIKFAAASYKLNSEMAPSFVRLTRVNCFAKRFSSNKQLDGNESRNRVIWIVGVGCRQKAENTHQRVACVCW
jgi:hypothetical protein